MHYGAFLCHKQISTVDSYVSAGLLLRPNCYLVLLFFLPPPRFFTRVLPTSLLSNGESICSIHIPVDVFCMCGAPILNNGTVILWVGRNFINLFKKIGWGGGRRRKRDDDVQGRKRKKARIMSDWIYNEIQRPNFDIWLVGSRIATY